MKSGTSPPMDNEPQKKVVHPKIFNVAILILVQDTLRNKRIVTWIVYEGGCMGTPVTPCLLLFRIYLQLS